MSGFEVVPVNKSNLRTVTPIDQPLGINLVDSKSVHKPSSPNDLVQLAMEVERADQSVRSNASNKLRQIAEQMKLLREQAEQVLKDSKRDADLHTVACNLVKKPGSIYYLYERESGENYLSLLSPQEWGVRCPNTCLGGYRLEFDNSWTPIEDMSQRDAENAAVNKILNGKLAITKNDGNIPNI